MLATGFTNRKATMKAGSPAAMTLPGWYGGRPMGWIGEVAATSNATYLPTVGSPIRGCSSSLEPFAVAEQFGLAECLPIAVRRSMVGLFSRSR